MENARCYGKEISDIFLWADYITTDGEVKRIEKNDFEWQYKISPFQKESNVILRAAFELETGEHSKIKSIMDKNFRDRRDKGHFKTDNRRGRS
ncbi:MAG: hypothetical protein B6229_01695 [Spirochaetaceae bacterium 4572_7]|nr:MAG: hypothetical protein B6229_01695 [Spirochaetaceae bacterium 4572_7]